MLVINSASVGGVPYWRHSAEATWWVGRGAAALHLEGPVNDEDLKAVLEGQGPAGGALTARPGLRRRQGWDLVVAAPKSVSLLAASGRRSAPGEAALLVEAFRRSVSDTVDALEQRAAYVVSAGSLRDAPAVVAGVFEHRRNDAGHPHLHAHVVLANLARPDHGQWGCLVGNEIWRWREALGAAFHMAMRSRLALAGFAFDWELSPGGLGEIGSVPAQARWSASARSRSVKARALEFGSASSSAGRVAQGATRRRTSPRPAHDPGPTGPLLGQPAPPAANGQEAPHGLDEDQVATILAATRKSPPAWAPAGPPGTNALAEALAGRSSTFNEPDVMVALAELTPQGMDLGRAMDWSRAWWREAQRSVPVAGRSATQTGTGQLPATTARAAAIDAHIVDVALEGRRSGMAQVSPFLAQRELAELATLAPVRTAALHLACAGEAVSALPRAPWLAQAACIDAARSVWQAAGMSVRVACPTELSARRWEALTSLRPWATRAQEGLGAPPGPRSDRSPVARAWAPGRRVLVVDAADHLSPLALERLVSGAVQSGTKLVLVPGGTVPGPERALARALDHLAGTGLPVALASLSDAPASALPPDLDLGHRAVHLPGSRVLGALTGTESLVHLARQWSVGAGEAHPGGRWQPPLMVAFGPAEAEALNAAARSLHLGLAAGQARPGPTARPGPAVGERQVLLGERWYATGDEVMALRRLGRAPAATRGTVVGGGDGHVTVRWRRPDANWVEDVGSEAASHLGYGYATTVPYLRGALPAEPVMVLGDPHPVARSRGGWRLAYVTLPGSGLPSYGHTGREARVRAGQAELAARWPQLDDGLGPGQPAWGHRRAQAPGLAR